MTRWEARLERSELAAGELWVPPPGDWTVAPGGNLTTPAAIPPALTGINTADGGCSEDRDPDD